MDQQAADLAAYLSRRLGEDLRAVGYHDEETVAFAHVREDLEALYPPAEIDRFIRASRAVHRDVRAIDREMGTPQSSLHVLEEGLIIQFHFPGEEVVFVSMEPGVGRNLTGFLEDCRERLT